MDNKPTVEELAYMISKLEQRIEALEEGSRKYGSVVLSGTNKKHREYIEKMKKQMAQKEGES